MSNKSQSLSNTLDELNAKPMSEKDLKASESISASAFTRPKYLKAQKNLTHLKIKQLLKANPDIELKDTLAAIIKDYPSEMPSHVISTMVQFIIREWEKSNLPEEIVKT